MTKFFQEDKSFNYITEKSKNEELSKNLSLINDKTSESFSECELISLKNKIVSELQQCGFKINGKKLEHHPSKNNIRRLHEQSVEKLREKYRKTLEKNEEKLLNYIADGKEISPEEINPKLIYVDSKTKYWDLFNYIKIHWSIPISSGYGRRLCYVIFDETNDKAIGILGLSDPVFSMGIRDNFIGWNAEEKKKNMRMIMDGFVIGSVPPYNFILGGKLTASLLFSNQIRRDFRNKYLGSTSLISKRKHSGNLVLLTTLSALGKSAMYDRIKLPNGQRYMSIGYSEGWGEFHFNGSTYEDMRKLVLKKEGATRKKSEWGTGFRNKREVVDKALRLLNIPKGYSKHGIKREQFLMPLAKNYKKVLTKNEKPIYYDISVDEISDYMKKRWVLPRSDRRPEFKKWKKEEYLLWN